MVPADDAQEPEPTTPQITAGNKPPTASSDSTARLTPMPAWLMHWWTPMWRSFTVPVGVCPSVAVFPAL